MSTRVDPRLEYAFGQVGADVGDRVADVVDSAVDRGADDELDEGLRVALADGRADLVDAVDAAHRRLDALGDLGLHLGRRGAGLGDDDDRRREFDVGIVVDVHPHEADQAEQGQRREQHEREDRVADRPAGNVAHQLNLGLPRRARGERRVAVL